ncbi:MAG: ATP-binding protein [Candidatus Omnitrophota bacterium]|jgi:PAS domain S-box-containing protein
MDKQQEKDNEIFRGLLENADVLVFCIDHDGRIAICNQKAEIVTGLKREAIIGTNWISLLSRGNDNLIKMGILQAVMDESVKHGRPKDFETIILDSGGQERVVSWNLSLVNLGMDKQFSRLLIGQDITLCREREISARKIDNTLKEAFSTIKEYAFYLTNLDGNITHFEPGAELMLGWSKKEVLFKHISLLHTENDAASKLNHILENVRLFGKYETSIDLLGKNREIIPAILTANQFLDNHGKMIGYCFIARDISEKKKLEYQIFHAEKMAAIGQLAAGMAHEINNPLFVISGRLQMLAVEKRLSDKVKKSLDLAITQADRIRKLVDQILKFSRKSTPQLESVDLNEILESVMPLVYYHKLPSAVVNIKKEFAAKMPAIRADAQQLQEVFLNLLINAHQAMPNGGTVRISTANFKNLFALVTIVDSGIGIHPDNLKNMFKPFFSTKNDGTGLGLFICYDIIKNHNGTIEMQSQPNQGTTVTIKLPFA